MRATHIDTMANRRPPSRDTIQWQRNFLVLLGALVVVVSFVQFQLLGFIAEPKNEGNAPRTEPQRVPTSPTPLLSDNEGAPTKLRSGLKIIPGYDPNAKIQRTLQDTNTGGAFVHLGKTGGSTLSILLRNGCHSFMAHPCRTVPNESPASRLIQSYYHVPDFAFLQQSHHDFYVLTVRDPYDRTVSAFCYEHVRNRLARNEVPDKLAKYQAAYQCFPTLETFAEYLQGDSYQFDYPYHKSQVHPDSCVDLARAAIHGKVKIFNHLYFGFSRIHEFLEPNRNSPHKRYYVVRQEALWHDWNTVNDDLVARENADRRQQSAYTAPAETATLHRRNITHVQVPVQRELSAVGVEALCRALRDEYQAYFWFLRQARNLQTNDLEFSLQRAKDRCGEHLEIDKLWGEAKL